MKEVASLRYDVIFKKGFSDPKIFTALVNDFLGIKLKITKVYSDYTFSPAVGNVATRFDLFAEDKENRIIVEMQHVHYPDTYERFLYYQCNALVETIKSSQNYHFPSTVFTMVFLTGKKSPNSKDAILVHDFEVKGLKYGELIKDFYPHQHKLYFIFTKSVKKNASEKYSEWMRAINDSLTKEVDETSYTNRYIQNLFKSIEKDMVTPEENANMKEEYNRAEAEKVAVTKGIAEGLKAGIAEGEKRGKQEEQLNIARSLLTFLDDKSIAKTTKLTIARIRKLRKEG